MKPKKSKPRPRKFQLLDQMRKQNGFTDTRYVAPSQREATYTGSYDLDVIQALEKDKRENGRQDIKRHLEICREVAKKKGKP